MVNSGLVNQLREWSRIRRKHQDEIASQYIENSIWLPPCVLPVADVLLVGMVSSSIRITLSETTTTSGLSAETDRFKGRVAGGLLLARLPGRSA